jgi:hypothetical protein
MRMTGGVGTRLLAVVAFLALMLAPARMSAAEAQFPLASRIGLTPPPGMELSSGFQGFEDRQNNVYIRVIALPENAFAELEKTMTNDALKKQGVIVEKRESIKTEEGQGLLIIARQDAKPARVRKWLLIAPLKGITGLISLEMPVDGKPRYNESAIRTALASVVSRATIPNEEQLKLVPFTIGDLTGMRIVRVLPGAAIQLTEGPGNEFEPNQPHLVISVSAGGPSQPSERGQFAQLALGGLPPFKDVRVTNSEPMRVNGMPGYETRAQAKDPRDGTDIEIVQWLRFGSGGYLRMVAFAPKTGWTENFMRFRTIRDSLDGR